MKKVLIILAVLVFGFIFSVSLFSRKAPDLLRGAIEKALNKTVMIRSIFYHFPSTFEMEGFEIKEKGRFNGETSFKVDQIKLSVSWLSLLRKKLVIDKISVENANILIRKYDGRLTHALSDAMSKSKPGASDKDNAAGTAGPRRLPLEIRHFVLRDSKFKFIDYDAQEGGFVIALDQIDATIRNIFIPFSSSKTTYKAKARLPQGRDQRPAEISMQGWTVFGTKDTDANLNMKGVFLPYFYPYYAQVTPAQIQDGYLDSRANIRVDKNDLALNVDLEIIGLLFQSYEAEDQLFGLKAEEILSFLKDRSGRLKFQFVAGWNLADSSVRARDVIRKSIERSLKKTIIGNVGNILENTLQKVNEQGITKTKDDIEGTIKKIKELFKY